MKLQKQVVRKFERGLEDGSDYTVIGFVIMLIVIGVLCFFTRNDEPRYRQTPMFRYINNKIYEVMQKNETAVMIYLREPFKSSNSDKVQEYNY